jgi:hypothetical protein
MTGQPLTPPGHESTAAIDIAARWLATTHRRDQGKNVIVQLRQRFGLSPVQACEAIREANLIRARAL